MNKVVHFEIPAEDLPRARSFYGSLFGWELPEMTMDDGTSSWHLDSDGGWERHHTGPDGPLTDLQAALIYRQRRKPGAGR